MKKTILYNEHLKLNAKMVEFAGYMMPIEYAGITKEHLAVREDVGLFDVSHMGQILIEGPEALAFANYLLSSRIKALDKRMVYALILNKEGGIKDDLMAYVYHEQKILLVVNASNLAKDYAWIMDIYQETSFNVNIEDLSSQYSQLALQGPRAQDVLTKLTNYDLNTMKLFDFDDLKIMDKVFLVSRSGYTGEDGFEIYGDHLDIVSLFHKLLSLGVTPCGLGARDTLRFEAAMPLYGHETNEDINPYEAGLGFSFDLTKDDFIGKEALVKINEAGIKRKVVALELLDRGIAREGYPVYNQDDEVGYITTGYLVPNHEKAYVLAMIDLHYTKIGTVLEVQIRKNKVKAVVRNKKFLNKKYKK